MKNLYRNCKTSIRKPRCWRTCAILKIQQLWSYRESYLPIIKDLSGMDHIHWLSVRVLPARALFMQLFPCLCSRLILFPDVNARRTCDSEVLEKVNTIDFPLFFFGSGQMISQVYFEGDKFTPSNFFLL